MVLTSQLIFNMKMQGFNISCLQKLVARASCPFQRIALRGIKIPHITPCIRKCQITPYPRHFFFQFQELMS